MHLFNMATVFIVVSLVGVEFSVAAFVDPAAWRLDPEPQLKLLSRARYPDLAVLAHIGARDPAYSYCDLAPCFAGIDCFTGSAEYSGGKM